MENIKLAVITPDREYGRALGLALVDVYKNFTVTLYQNTPVHKELESFDLILREQEECGENIICLAEKPSMADKDFENRQFRLYKYSNVRQLAGELLFIYTFLTGRKAIPIKNQDTKIAVFGAAEGGVGCTSAAVAFAQDLRRFHNKKVLYISMEELESTLEYMEPFPEGRSISQYLYYLFNDDSRERFPFIESFLVFDYYGVDAFLPSPGRNVLKSLSAEEMQYFISAAMDTGRYDFLVVDAGCSLDKSTLCCYEMANYICLVTRDHTGTYKEERMMEYLLFLKGEQLGGRMARVVNHYQEQEEEEEESLKTREDAGLLYTVCRLPEDPESFAAEQGIKMIRSDGAFGKTIGQISRAVLTNTLKSPI